MTVVVGYPPRRTSPGVLELATTIARARDEPLLVVTVVPPRWSVPSMARVDSEFAQWAAAQGRTAQDEATASLSTLPTPVSVEFRSIADRSAAGALARVADEVDASVIVVGSSEDGRRGRIELGSTSDRLVHSSRESVAVAPRGYSAPADGLTRITCAIAGHASDADLVRSATALAAGAGIPLRLATFAVRLDTMYPPEIGFDAEDDVVRALAEQAGECVATLRTEGVVAPEVEAVVGVGSGWRAAVESIPWQDDELLVIGTNPRGSLARVFLGSSATKIVRHSPVPVLVAPES
ncbi:MAG: universal stress protein [Microbacterium sp.]